MGVEISTAGLEEAIGQLQDLPHDLRNALADRADEIVEDLRAALATYPEEREGQRYVRTYTLQSGWEDTFVQVTYTSDGLTLSLINPVDYTGDVQVEPQKAFFVGRWPSTDTIAAQQEPLVAGKVENIVRDFVGRN